MNLYENSDATRVMIVQDKVCFNNGLEDADMIVYRGVDIFRGPVGVRAMPRGAFFAMFKLVEWQCGIDLCHILSQHMDADTAARVSTEIEAELFAVAERAGRE